MKILVTGGCGFIGSNYVLKQVKRNNPVLNLDKLTYAGNMENLSSIIDDPNYSFVQGDICDSELVPSTISDFQPDAIVHFAAESHVDRSIGRRSTGSVAPPSLRRFLSSGSDG